jgi:CRP-like cAMP-binding protein
MTSPPNRLLPPHLASSAASPVAKLGEEAGRIRLAAVLEEMLHETNRTTHAALVRKARLHTFVRHDLVAAQGDASLVIVVIVGHLGGWRSDAEGQQHMVKIAPPGTLINVVALHRNPSVVDLVGLDEGLVALWPGDLVMTLARRDPGLGIDLLGLALTGAEGLLQRIDRMKFDSVTRRLAGILWVHRDLLFDPHRPLLSRPELADLAGATREMTGRVIRDFEHRGLVGRTGRSGLVLLDAEGLRAEAGITVDEPTR